MDNKETWLLIDEDIADPEDFEIKKWAIREAILLEQIWQKPGWEEACEKLREKLKGGGKP